MATNLENLVVRLTMDDTQFKKSLRSAESRLMAVQKSVGKTQKAVQSATKATTAANAASAGFLSTMGRLKTKFQSVSAGFEGMANNFYRMARSINRLGGSLMRFITMPVALVSGTGIGYFVAFDKAMTDSISKFKKLSKEQRKYMENVAIKLSEKSSKSATDLAGAYQWLARAGFNAAQSVKALGTVMRFSVAGGFDLARATELLTDSMNSFGMKVSDTTQNMKNMKRISDVLSTASVTADATTEQFAEALARAGAQSRMYGQSIEQTVGALSVLADMSIKGQSAGRRLAMAFRHVLSRAAENEEQFKEHQIEVFKDGKEMRNYSDILLDLRKLYERVGKDHKKWIKIMTEELDIPVRGKRYLEYLIMGAKEVDKNVKILEKDFGRTAKMYEKVMGSIANQWLMTWHKVSNAMMNFILKNEEAKKSFRSVMKTIRGAVKSWRELSDEVQKNIVKWALWAAAVGPAIYLTSQLVMALGGLAAMGSFAMSALSGMATILMGVFKWAKIVAGCFAKTFARGLGALLGPLFAVIKWVGIVIGSLIVLTSAIRGVVGAFKYFSGASEKANEQTQKQYSWFEKLNIIVQKAILTWKKYGGLVGYIAKTLTILFKKLLVVVGETVNALYDLITLDIKGAKKDLGDVQNAFQSTFTDITKAHDKYVNDVYKQQEKLWDAMEGKGRNPLEKFKEKMEEIKEKGKATLEDLLEARKSDGAGGGAGGLGGAPLLEKGTQAYWQTVFGADMNPLRSVEANTSDIVSNTDKINESVKKLPDVYKSSLEKYVWGPIKEKMIGDVMGTNIPPKIPIYKQAKPEEMGQKERGVSTFQGRKLSDWTRERQFDESFLGNLEIPMDAEVTDFWGKFLSDSWQKGSEVWQKGRENLNSMFNVGEMTETKTDDKVLAKLDNIHLRFTDLLGLTETYVENNQTKEDID